jgi:ectoine hydroxylase-related dioxygenase (phytanoyl-CoA dioxygenase family)
MTLDDGQIGTFRRRGCCVIPGAIPECDLPAMREAADTLVEAARRGEPIAPSFLREGQSYEKAISTGTSRIFFSNRCERFPALESFCKGPIAAAIARALLGPDVFLFNEQVVVKAPRHGGEFAWHQDSGYIAFAHRPYLTLWCAFDDATRDNGTVHVIPCDLDAPPNFIEHRWNSAGGEFVGYDGEDPGEIVEVAAGTIIAFSSLTLHRTGPNRTDRPRRAYVCQYTAEPLLRPDTGRPHNRVLHLTS